MAYLYCIITTTDLLSIHNNSTTSLIGFQKQGTPICHLNLVQQSNKQINMTIKRHVLLSILTELAIWHRWDKQQ